MCPSINANAGDIAKLPLISVKESKKIEQLVEQNVTICKEDWDSFELSWNFNCHPFIVSVERLLQKGKQITVKHAYEEWEALAEQRFNTLKENEEELNWLFIQSYNLQKELTKDVSDRDITVCKANLIRDMRSFVSYAVGCMFGRYALEKPGIIYAGGEWDISTYQKYLPDADGIIPICDDDYFNDDIVYLFEQFVKTVYGASTLEENLAYIASVLLSSNGKLKANSSREIIRKYFLNDFFRDHLKTYQKHPIYWLFDSGKNNGFKCLIYMHRYQPDTIARIRTDYVHEQQSRYRTAITDCSTG